MEGISDSVPVDEVTSRALVPRDEGATPFSQECVRITKQEYIDLTARANYWKAQHARVKAENEVLKQEIAVKDAKIKELQNRLFGKKSEKDKPKHSEKGASAANNQAAGDMDARHDRISPSWSSTATFPTTRKAVRSVACPMSATRPWTSKAM